ncbi:MAG: TIR domain-containing protein [Chloroflexi bacterium]|nr:TIR domain-containing protein [Chloroflexota bacterium]
MSKTTTQPLKAFLCHASGDKPAVREMYKRLVFEGVDAWLDKEKLLPGQDWRVEIPRAVQEADVVIVFLSKKSVSKEGYVQKEIKFALDIAEEKPEGTIFLIPARLEDCLVPERLSRWQWVDLFEDNGFVQLLRSLKLRARAVGATVEPASYEDPDRETAQRVEQLYTEGLAAFYTEDWDRACQRFRTILSEQPGHKNASEKLAEAEKQRNLTRLYAQAEREYKAENWRAAIQSLEELLAQASEYKDAEQLLKNAKRKKRLDELYVEAKALHMAQKWQAVLKVFEQIAAIDPTCPDPDNLLSSAQKEVAELKRIADLNEQYSLAVRRMDAGQWMEARTLLEKVHKSQTGFLETERLLRKAEDEITKVESQNRRRDQVNLLYEQAHGLIRSKNWRKALDKIEEIQGLDSQFEDKDGITEQAKAELAREEQKIQRQNELAAMYAESVRLMQGGQYQDALDKWEEVRRIDPKYPDRQWVQRTAKKKLAEMTKPVKVKLRVATNKSARIGMTAIVVVVISIVGIIVLEKYGQQILSLPTHVPTQTTVPFFTSASIPEKTSTPQPSTPTPVMSSSADMMIYDDFENSAFNGKFDDILWELSSDDSKTKVVQSNGLLKVESSGYNKGVSLKGRQIARVNTPPVFLEASVKLDPNQNGGIGINYGIDVISGYCQIWAMNQRQHIYCYQKYGQVVESTPYVEIDEGTWHTLRIEIIPGSPLRIVYIIDGLTIKEYTISTSKKNLIVEHFSVFSGCSGNDCIDKSPRTLTGYVDYVRIGAIEDDPASQEPFYRVVGEWEAADWSDGSLMAMTIKRVSAGQYTFLLVDNLAGFCDGGSGKADFKADTFSNTATGTFEFVCDSSGNSGNFEYKFTYNSVNDQFVDAAGVIWHRKK